MVNDVPSLQAIVCSQIPRELLFKLRSRYTLPRSTSIGSCKELLNIKILGSPNPRIIVTKTELDISISNRREKYIHKYIHPVTSCFGHQSPRTKRLNILPPETRRDVSGYPHGDRWTKVEFYNWYWFDHKLAKKKWEENEERLSESDDGSFWPSTKIEFYNFYRNIKVAEEKWDNALVCRHVHY